MRMTRIVWRRFRAPIALGAGALLGVAATAAAAYGSVYRDIRLERVHLAELQRAVAAKPKEEPAKDPLLEQVPLSADRRLRCREYTHFIFVRPALGKAFTGWGG